MTNRQSYLLTMAIACLVAFTVGIFSIHWITGVPYEISTKSAAIVCAIVGGLYSLQVFWIKND